MTDKRVDESWKDQVEKEQSKLRSVEPEATSGAPGEPVPGRSAPAADKQFESLVSNLAMEAFVHLGDIPHPATNRSEANLTQAKYIIDVLGMLEVKTQGNLAAGELQQLTEYLYQLRTRYVEKTQPPIPPPPGAQPGR